MDELLTTSGKTVKPTSQRSEAFFRKGGAVDLPQTISSTNLAPAPDIDIPQTPIETETTGLLGQIGAQTDAFQKRQDKLAEETKSLRESRNDSLESLLSTIGSAEGEVARTAKEYSKEGGVDQTQAELSDINQQILEEQERLRRQEEAIEDNAKGLESTGVQGELNRVRRESLRTQADLSVIQLAKQGKYDSAKAIADRAVAAQLEGQKQELETREFIYNQIKEELTTKEQRLFETQQAERTRLLDNEEYRLRAEYDQKIKQSDPLYQLDLRIKQASAREAELKIEALENADASVVSPEVLEKIQDLDVNGRETLVNTTDTIDQLTRVKDLVENNSTEDLANPFTEAGRLYQRLTTDIADKMARERTGAVVRDEEQASFKKILGVGFGNQLLATPEEINKELDKFIGKHNNSAFLIDPSGDIRKAMKSQITNEDSYLDSIESVISIDPISEYLNGLMTPK